MFLGLGTPNAIFAKENELRTHFHTKLFATPTISRWENIKAIREEKRLRKGKENLLGVEGKFITQIDNQIQSLQQIQKDYKIFKPVSKFLAFDLSIFDIFDEQGFPRLAPFSLINPICTLNNYNYTRGVPREVLDKLCDIYKERQNRMYPEYKSRYFDSLLRPKEFYDHYEVTFDGIIPDEIRDCIPKWKEVFREVYIIADVTGKWEKSTTNRFPMNPDPFIVGWDGTYSRLLAEFDLTPFERWAKAEMAIEVEQ